MQQEVLVCLLELDHNLFLRERLPLSSGGVAFSRRSVSRGLLLVRVC